MLFIIVIIIRHYLIVFQKILFCDFQPFVDFFLFLQKNKYKHFLQKSLCFFLVVYYIMILNYQINVVVAKGLKNKTALQTVLIRV